MEYYETSAFGEAVAKLCIDFFNTLPKTGKPKHEEWTVLACVVKSVKDADMEVISLGTGSKCIGQNQMSAEGDVLNDSHAEVMARRGFIRYLYEQVELAAQSKLSIMSSGIDGKFVLMPDIDFHFFSSQSPCGDASIITDTHDDRSSVIDDSEDNTILIKNTGAKCIKKDIDLKSDYDKPTLGQVRRKPGKGDPTLSVSCSDKLARWIRVGFQGALLDTILQDPITVKTIVIGNDISFSKESIDRALFKRVHDEINNDDLILNYKPKILHSTSVLFGYRKDPHKQPCDSSIVWCKVKERSLEIAVAGRKQGVTKKNISKYSSCLKISKKSLFTKYISVMKLLNSSDITTKSELPFVSDEKTYKEMKNESLRYYKKWSSVKESFFGVWSEKPDILNFKSAI